MTIIIINMSQCVRCNCKSRVTGSAHRIIMSTSGGAESLTVNTIAAMSDNDKVTLCGYNVHIMSTNEGTESFMHSEYIVTLCGFDCRLSVTIV